MKEDLNCFSYYLNYYLYLIEYGLILKFTG